MRERIASRTAGPVIQSKCDSASGGDCGCGGKKKIQRKGREPEPYDRFEEEADRVAEQVPSGAMQPLSWYERTLGHDFSRVRIHDDPAAHALADAQGARAFTYGSDVYLARGELARPDASRLIAHELAHTVQQSAATAVRRKVADDYPKLKKLLSYSITDWKIFDREAHEALEILAALGATDLADTVAKMEEDGLVDHLFGNVPDKDKETYGTLLQKIQNARVHKVKEGEKEKATTDSCTPVQRAALLKYGVDAIGGIVDAEFAVRDYIDEPAAAANAATLAALDRHFHATDIPFATLVKNRLSSLSTDIAITSVPLRCAAPTDLSCEQKTAIAYNASNHSEVIFCQEYFDRGDDQNIETYIHELCHATMLNLSGVDTVDDRAYSHRRLYPFLSPAEALDNADSFSEFVREVSQKKVPTVGGSGTETRDCKGDQIAQARRAVARAEDWALSTRSVLWDDRPTFHTGYASLRLRHFGTDDPKELPALRERFDAVRARFQEDIAVECESGGVCDEAEKGKVTTGYYRYFIWRANTLHVCPAFFNLGEQEQNTEMLTLVVMNATGLDEPKAEPYAFLARDVVQKYWGAPPPLPK